MPEQYAPAAELALQDAAVELVHRWVQESEEAPVDVSAQRLAWLLNEPQGAAFVVGLLDGVLRPATVGAAASNLHRVAPLTPAALPWYLKTAVQVGSGIASALPLPTVPVARAAVRELLGRFVVDAKPGKLGAALERIRAAEPEAPTPRLDVNLLGAAVTGAAQITRRIARLQELVRRDDIDALSVSVSEVLGGHPSWGFDAAVEAAIEHLTPLFLNAAAHGTTITLDIREYAERDLTIAVFTRMLDDARLRHCQAGITLQAYLPDTLPALRELTAWAGRRVEHGGAPITVRLTKGSELAAERNEAVLRGWTEASYGSKLDTDANFLRCLREAFQPENAKSVHIGVASHNLFDLAYAWLLAGERRVRDAVHVEMLLGVMPTQFAAVARTLGSVTLSVPVVHADEREAATGYLVRRVEEAASRSGFLCALPALAADHSLFERERFRFVDSVRRAGDHSLRVGARRVQNRAAPLHESVRRHTAAREQTEDLTGIVLDIARGSSAEGGGDPFLHTAVFSKHEQQGSVLGAPGFTNTPDSDPTLAANRAWSRTVFEGMATPHQNDGGTAITHQGDVAQAVARAREGAVAWGARPAAERSEVLLRAAAALDARRGELIAVAGSETGKTFTESDAEVSAAVDFARYYAATCRELDGISGARFEPSGLIVVASPWSFPIAAPAGGALAALAAGSATVLKPAPQARRCAALIAETLWQAGIPRDVLMVAELDDGDPARALITHPEVDRVLLTGSWDTAAEFLSWRDDLPLLAHTSGKNAMIIAPTADLEQAVADLMRSAFGHAGQKCSAASLAILVGPVGRSQKFARMLADAARSLTVGQVDDPATQVGPLIDQPGERLGWALTELEGDEKWLVQPKAVDETGRLWTPGVRVGVQPGTRSHREEFFGPVLSVMHAPTLSAAIDLQNATDFGLTAGLHTQNPEDLALWLDTVQAGNLYVNRGITGSIVQRQPFGGWKRSVVGAVAKVGGPNQLLALGTWRSQPRGKSSSTLHLRGLDVRISGLIEAAQPALDFDSFEWLRQAALSDAVAWDREFGQVRDVSQLGIERNLFRYRPAAVILRATSDAGLHEVLRVVLAGIRSGSSFFLSVPGGVPAGVRAELSALGVAMAVENDTEFSERVRRRREQTDAVADRVRLIGSSDSVRELRRALTQGGDPDLAIYADEVTSAGRLELLPFLREQAVSITAQRFGIPDPWSTAVI